MLTPIDIQNHSLKTAVRGYSKKETDDFLEEILQGYESLYKENRELKDKVTSLSEGVQYYKQMETTLQKALVLAEKTSTETQEAAKSKADAMTNEAQAKSEAMTNEAQ
ncbi:MAG TPA: septum formation initiator, partial [Lachnospiraceae bacterium]|nr:septum formation initiator [Lachnospiraceae bacterium]